MKNKFDGIKVGTSAGQWNLDSEEDFMAFSRNCKELQQRMHQISLHLVRYRGRPGGKPHGLTSGFFVLKDNEIFVITAGHSARKKGQWFWETNLSVGESGPLLIPLGPFILLDQFSISKPAKTSKKIDFAWCRIDLGKIREELQKLSLSPDDLDANWYLGPLDHVPDRDDYYTFAAPSGADTEKPRLLYLHKKSAVETLMRYQGMKPDGRYIFTLDGQHKGHAYYRGASGAPICGSEGVIVSVLIGGHPTKNEIYGANLARHLPTIGCMS